MALNTFIAVKADGSKVDFMEGKSHFEGLNSLYEAKYCTCDENTTNVSEIPDWDEAEVVAGSYEDK